MKSTLLHKKLLLCGLLTAPLFIMAQKDSITSGVFHWNELPLKKEKDRDTRKILEGSTREFSWLEIHATTQYKGAVPRPAHAQDSIEELIIIKEGQLKCMVGDKTATLCPGSVILIPPHVSQAFENTGHGPVSYYVLMFRSRQPADLARSDRAGGALIINADTLWYTEKDNKGTRKYFERPTAMCSNYEMHTTTLLTKGPSHAAHQHADTEIILVLSGETGMTIDGKEYTGTDGDLFIAESGKLHGVRNAADRPCTYFAFKWR